MSIKVHHLERKKNIKLMKKQIVKDNILWLKMKKIESDKILMIEKWCDTILKKLMKHF